MTTGATAQCQLCASPFPRAMLAFSREVLTAETVWHPVAGLGQAPLCDACATWFADLMHTAAAGRGDPIGRLGVPTRSPGSRATDDGCDFCHSPLNGTAITAGLVPDGHTAAGPRRASIVHQRLCGYCAAWLQSVVYDPSAMRQTSARRDEGPMGAWRSIEGANAATCGLLASDGRVVSTVLAASGFASIETEGTRLAGLLATGHVGFVGARGREAELVTRRLTPELLGRVAVVAYPGGLEDAFAAIRAGAADFLASPLSPQQVAGAIDRIVAGTLPAERGPLLGLAVYRGPLRDGYGVAHPIALRLLKPEHAPLAALLLRRFVRGYDRVGEDGEGGLRAMVYCPQGDLPFVVARLSPILTDVARVSVTR